MNEQRHNPDYADDPPYQPSGKVSFNVMLKWFVDNLTPTEMRRLAQRATSESEAAEEGSTEEATIHYIASVLEAE